MSSRSSATTCAQELAARRSLPRRDPSRGSAARCRRAPPRPAARRRWRDRRRRRRNARRGRLRPRTARRRARAHAMASRGCTSNPSPTRTSLTSGTPPARRPAPGPTAVVILTFPGSPSTVRTDAPAHSIRPRVVGEVQARRLGLRDAPRGAGRGDTPAASAPAPGRRDGSVPTIVPSRTRFTVSTSGTTGTAASAPASHGLDDRREQLRRCERPGRVVHGDDLHVAADRVEPRGDRPLACRSSRDDDHGPRRPRRTRRGRASSDPAGATTTTASIDGRRSAAARPRPPPSAGRRSCRSAFGRHRRAGVPDSGGDHHGDDRALVPYAEAWQTSSTRGSRQGGERR